MKLLRPARTSAVVLALALGLTGVASGAAQALSASSLSCGEVVTASVTLTANLHCTGDGLIVDPDADVTLDLGGYTVTGSGSGTGITLESADYDSFAYTVQNGTVSGFATGVSATNIDDVTVSGVKLVGDASAVAIGPVVFGVTVSGDTIKQAQYDFAFFGFQTSVDSFAVSDNTIVGGLDAFSDGLGTAYYSGNHIVDSPLYLSSGGNDRIVDNVFKDSEVQELSSGGQLQITGNRMSGASIGLLDESLGGDTISGNVLSDDGLGAEISEIYGGGADIITGNTFRDNKASGLYLYGGPGTDTVSSNTAVRNGSAPNGLTDPFGHPLADGITIDEYNGGQATLTDNGTRADAAFGIYVDGPFTDGGGNTSKADPDQCSPLDLCTY